MIELWLTLTLSLIVTPSRLELAPAVANGEIVWREKGKTFVQFKSGPMPAPPSNKRKER